MKVNFTLFFLLLFSSALLAQTSARKQFSSISRPEKCWAFTHPFIAKKAFKITLQVRKDVDSIKQTGVLGTDLNGGKLDAFKHAYWMESLSVTIGSRKALKLGKAHEKGNYLEYKKRRLEDGILPDSVSSAMDNNNNRVGASIGNSAGNSTTKSNLQLMIIDKIKTGELYIIRKDTQGNYLKCDGTIINLNDWKGKWNIPKCLIRSNQQ